MRLQKYLSQAGVCSRREAESWILEGLVRINGKIAELGAQVAPGDSIKVGRKLYKVEDSQEGMAYLVYKPAAVLANPDHDPEGRPTLHPFVRHLKRRVVPVGNLEFTQEGLMFLSTNGSLAREIQASKVLCTYEFKVRREEPIVPKDLQKLQRGGMVDGRPIKPVWVKLKRQLSQRARIEVGLRGLERRNIRKWFENKGFQVESIRRVALGPALSKTFGKGEIVSLSSSDLKKILDYQPASS